MSVPQSDDRRAAFISGGPHGENAGGPQQHWAKRIYRQTYWETRLGNTHPIRSSTLSVRENFWDGQAETAAEAYCAEQGYTKTRNIRRRGSLPANFQNTSGTTQEGEGWGYLNLQFTTPNIWSGQAYTYVLWSATCEKRVRVRRSRR